MNIRQNISGKKFQCIVKLLNNLYRLMIPE